MFLGIDLGTSGVKATLIDAAEAVLGAATAPLDVARPQPGWSEQNPHDWIAAAAQALDALHATHAGALAAVRGIGLSGQMHGATLLDERDEPLRPCLLWNDTRAHAEAAELDRDPRFRALTGNIVFPGFTAPKVAWVRRHEPRVFERVRRVLLPKDFLRLWLTGEHASDMSDASGTSWLDTGARRWSGELLAATGLDVRQVPSLLEGTAVSGVLRGELAARWGMHGRVVVAGGAGDNAASACGLGVVRDGAAFVSLGTSGVLFAANGAYSPNAASAVHAFCHAVPGTWHQMGVILSATDSLSWLAALTGTTPADLTASLGTRLASPGRVTFLPYLGGERTPHNDATIRGAFAGMGHETDRRALAQAVVEGVAFALCDSRDALRAAGTTITRLAAVGGGTRSRYWLQVLATALNLPLDVPVAGDFGAAFGAARLGMIAATGADPGRVCAPPPIGETVEPDAEQVAAYAAARERYRALYPAIRGAS
ncbi:MAG TPA: xylulokinase [Gammaproteobacteria bacterium]|jgi:xylulokinase|nr:xylulokinase [Gammaproteobacteria bacterium]